MPRARRVHPDKLLRKVINALSDRVELAMQKEPPLGGRMEIAMWIEAKKDLVKTGELLMRIAQRLNPVPGERDLKKMSDEDLVKEKARLEAAK